MITAFQVWKEGAEWWEVRDDGTFVATVDGRVSATIHGATVFVEADEPRFIVRDESGRGWCAEWKYREFDNDERSRREDDEDEYCQTLGEWLDNSSAGDEYSDSDSMTTIIRIN